MTQIIAHRGASNQAPENTMPAFELAYELGAESIETDVHLTKDQIPVLIHDDHVERTTDGQGQIADYTFSELQQLDAGSWFSAEFSLTRIISLENFLKWAQSKPFQLNIELKNHRKDYIHLESIVFEMLDYFNLLNRTILSSFNPKSIQRMHAFKKHVQIAFLTSRRRRQLCDFAMNLGANALHIKYNLLTERLVRQCHKQKMPIRIFTVNRAEHMQRCFRFKCDGIFTDHLEKAFLNRTLFYNDNS